MKHRKIVISGFFIFSFGLSGVYAQEIANTSGGDASGTGGSTSYSIGLLNYTTDESVDGSIAQGVQHAYEIFTVGVGDNSNIHLTFKAFPNPTVDYLTLEIGDYASTNLSYQLYDVSGKILETNRITDNVTSIDMKDRTPGSYFLKVRESQIEMQTFKIIKK